MYRNKRYEKLLIILTVLLLGLWILAFHMVDPVNGYSVKQGFMVGILAFTGSMQTMVVAFVYLDMNF